MEQDRFTMEYGLHSKNSDKLVALGSANIVSFHYIDKVKVDLPTKWVKALEKFSGN